MVADLTLAGQRGALQEELTCQARIVKDLASRMLDLELLVADLISRVDAVTPPDDGA